MSLARTLAQTSMAATAKRCPGPVVSVLTLSMATVDSTNRLVEGGECLVNGIALRVEDLLVRAEMATERIRGSVNGSEGNREEV